MLLRRNRPQDSIGVREVEDANRRAAVTRREENAVNKRVAAFSFIAGDGFAHGRPDPEISAPTLPRDRAIRCAPRGFA